MKKFVTILAVLICVSMAIPVYALSEEPTTEIIDGIVQFPLYPIDDILQDGTGVIPGADMGEEGIADPGNFDYQRFSVVHEQWEAHGYPDDIGGVYFDSEAEKMGVLVVNPKPERIEELHSMLGEETIITPCVYSYNELTQVNEEIVSLLNPDSKIYYVSLGWTNTDGIVHGFGESGKEFRVLVGVDESEFVRYRDVFAEQYGGMVMVGISDGEGIPYLSNDSYLGGYTGTPNNYYLWIVPVILAIGLLGTFAIVQRQRTHRISAMQTTIGDVITASAPATRKETIAAIKNSAVTPPDSVYKSIMEKVDNKQ